MEIAWILTQQVMMMFLLIALGVFLCRKQVIGDAGAKSMSDLLTLAIIPCLVINAFQVEMDEGVVRGLLLSFGLAVFTHLLGIVLAKVVFRKRPDAGHRVERFAAVYSNSGFMGLPLVQASFGSEGVIYATVYLAVFNLCAFTFGALELKGKREKGDIVAVLTKPVVLSVVAAVLLFAFQIKLPVPIAPAVQYIGSMNTPLGMLLCGVYLARTDLRGLFKKTGLYLVAAFRLCIIPLLLIGVYALSGLGNLFVGAEHIIIISLVSAACPTAAVTSILSASCGQDATYGGQLVAVTTVLSILTLPLVSLLAAAVI